MSAIGKVFIVLNLVFSLVIVGAAASYLSKADDWKANYEAKDKEFKEAKDKWDTDASSMQADLTRRDNDNQFLQNNNDNLKHENETLIR